MPSENTPLMDNRVGESPKAPWADALSSERDTTRKLPQCIAHRGFKAQWPENSMGGFKAAVAAGAHALETDLHLSRDGVIVLSHDPSLKRCFGVDKKIIECDWEYLSGLETLKEPKEHLPRLEDLLVWLNEEERLHVWLLLDIKRDDDAKALTGALVRVLEDVKGVKPWDQRLILACWNATYLRACQRLLPTYPLAHTSFFLPYARHFLHRIPNLNFNLFYRSLHGPLGSYFLHQAAKHGRQVFAWTVNDESWMEWCIRKDLSHHGNRGEKGAGKALIDGVITDDPALFLEVCSRVEDEAEGKIAIRKGDGGVKGGYLWVKKVMVSVAINLLATTFFLLLFLRRDLDI